MMATREEIHLCDLHIGAPHQLKEWSFERLMDEYTENTFIMGDCFDFANAKKKALLKLLEQQRLLILRYKKQYILGNHDRFSAVTPSRFYTIREGVLYTHGDWKIFWPDSQVQDWIERDMGKGTFSRFGYSIYKNGAGLFLDQENEYKPSAEILLNVQNLVEALQIEHNTVIHSVYIGHRHKPCRVQITDDLLFVTNTRGATVNQVMIAA